VIVGFFTAVTNPIDADAVRKSVKDSIPKRTEDLNLPAFDRGYEYGLEVMKKQSALAEAVSKN